METNGSVKFSTCIECGARNLTIRGIDKSGGKYVQGKHCKHQDGLVALVRKGLLYDIEQVRDSKTKTGFVYRTPFGIFGSMTEARSVLS